jgi:hypothetical protein
MKEIYTVLFTAGLIFLNNGHAQMKRSYDMPFNPDRVQALGVGFDAIDMEDRFVKCIKSEQVEIDRTPNLGTKLSSSFVGSNKEILKQLDIGVTSSMDMNFAELFSGSASFSAHYNKYFNLKEDEAAFTLVLSQDYGRQGILSSEILPKYQKLLDEGKFSEFRSQCGTHYYTLLSKRSYVMALVRMKGLSTETKSDLALRYSSSLSIPSIDMSGKLGIDYVKMVKEVEQLTNISIEFYSIGGEGVSKLSSVIANSTNNNISQMVKSISLYAESMSSSNSAPAKFKVAMYAGFPNESLNLSYREKRKLKKILKNTENNIIAIDKLEQDQGIIESHYSSYLIEYLLRQNESHKKMVDKCFTEGICNIEIPNELKAFTIDKSLDKKIIEVNCQYEQFKGREYLSTIKPILKANLIFPERVSALELFEFKNDSLKMIESSSTIGSYLGKQRTKEVYEASYWYSPLKLSISLKKLSSFDGSRAIYEKRIKSLDQYSRSKFWLKLKFVGEKEILYSLGSINLMNCPLVK